MTAAPTAPWTPDALTRTLEDKPESRHGADTSDLPGGPPLCVYPTEDALVYVACPVCRKRIEEPFQRFSGPVAFVHRHSRRSSARMVVTPDPHGEAHRVVHVGDDVSLDDALVRALQGGG